MTFEDVLKEINDFGTYQKLRYLLICVAALLPPIVTYLHSFTAANPNHRCKNPFNANDVFESKSKNDLSFYNITRLDKCNITYSDNHSEYCNKWVFDKTYYRTTLTEDWSMVCDRAFLRGSVQTVYFMGYLVGSIVMGILADHFGRKPIMLSSFIMIIIGCTGTAFGPQESFGILTSYIIYTISRFLIACGTRGINVTGFVLGMEMMGPNKRTFAGIVIEYFFALGQLILVFIAFFVRDWRTLSWIIILLTIPFLSYFFMLPESPRWLLSKRREDDALKVLNNVAKVNKKEFNQQTWNHFLEEQKVEKKNSKESIANVIKSYKLTIICIVLFINWMINNLIFYGVGLKSNDLGVNPYLSFAISAIVEMAAYVLTHFILDIIGRKLPYCVFLFLAGASCLSISFFENVQIELVMAMIGKFCASASYAIIYLYSSELFPTSIRNSCMGACSMMARIGSMIAPLIINLGDLGWKDLPFVVFGISGLIGSLTILMFPETLGRELPLYISEAERISEFGFSFRYTPKLHNESNSNELENLKLNEIKSSQVIS